MQLLAFGAILKRNSRLPALVSGFLQQFSGSPVLWILSCLDASRRKLQSTFSTPWRYWRTIITLCSGVTATTTYTPNLDYTADGNGGFSGTTVYFPQSGKDVNIYAYAPRKTDLTLDGNYSFTVKADQSKDADYIVSDLLWGQPMKLKTGSTTDYEPANPVARTKENVPVSFKHLLSKIEIELVAGDGLTTDDFNVSDAKVLFVVTGAISVGGVASDIGLVDLLIEQIGPVLSQSSFTMAFGTFILGSLSNFILTPIAIVYTLTEPFCKA